MILSTINVVSQFSTFLGLLTVALAIFYVAFSIRLLTRQRQSGNVTALYILQLLFAPVVLLLAGVIMFLQGWKLDPILQFSFLLLNALVIFLAAKEILLYRN